MFADAEDTPADARILEGFGIGDFDAGSVRGFRNRFAATRPDHVWVGLDDDALLEMLGAIRTDRETGRRGVTLGGVLMFGKHQAIISPGAAPSYSVDFRDYRGRENTTDRWTDRLFPDGTWEANLFQFYTRCWPKLVADLKVPFALRSGQRIDDSPIHVALREAMVNALIHTDYAVGGGIVIERYEGEYKFSNPGTLLVTEDQLRKGGISECRNRTLQRMFINIGAGDQAGSGYERIQAGWRSQHWRAPHLATQYAPDRIRLDMPMTSLIPDEAIAALRKTVGAKFNRLGINQRAALATAFLEGAVSNSRMQDLISDHPADITKMLRGLVDEGHLKAESQGRWTRYVLPQSMAPILTPTLSPVERVEAALTLSEKDFRKVAERAKGSKPNREAVEIVILRLCSGKYQTASQLAAAMGRKSVPRLRENYITPMVADGRLVRLHENYDHPEQAYRTVGT